MEPEKDKELLILEINTASKFMPSISIEAGKAIIAGTEEQFFALWEMIGDQYDFQTDCDCEGED
jgi:hypothetical protein